MKITVIGTGYLGAVHATCMAELGHDVLGVDVDERKVAALAAGQAPFFEPGLEDSLSRMVSAGKLRFTSSLVEAAEFGEVHFVCVGTPQTPGSFAADLKYVDAAVDGLLPHIRSRSLIVGKSTVPVGTAERLALKAATASTPDAPVELAWNPEFLREGFAMEDTLSPDRLVLGVESEYAEQVLRQLYAPLLEKGTPLIVTDFPTAELVKVAANAFLATKISFINAMAEVCEAAGGDVVTLSRAIGHDARIGHRFLAAGLGFGGGCLPKDIRAFRARAGELGADEALSFLREVDEINMRRREHAVDLVRELLGGNLLSHNVTVLGAAFKPNSDDVRDSPALAIAAAMQLKGAAVTVHDPEAIDNARRNYPTLRYAESLDDALAHAEVVVLATEWSDYRTADPAVLRQKVAVPRMLDARNVLDVPTWRAAGWTIRAIGRPRA